MVFYFPTSNTKPHIAIDDIHKQYPRLSLEPGEFVHYTELHEPYLREYPCVNEKDGALFVLTSKKYGYKMDPDPEIIKTAELKFLNEYVHIHHVDYYKTDKYHNLLRCNYFEAYPETIKQYSPPEIKTLGHFGGTHTQQDFKYLIAFLRATKLIGPIQQCSMNCKMTDQKFKIIEDEKQIIIKETTSMEVFDDTTLSDTNIWSPSVEYILEKDSGLVSERRMQN